MCMQVCLVPQAFHNAIYPDLFDNTNVNFMFRLMPYYFGAGCCFITGAWSESAPLVFLCLQSVVTCDYTRSQSCFEAARKTV